MDTLDIDITRVRALQSIASAFARLKWLRDAERFELAMRRHALALKYGYNPAQPRVPKGEEGAGQWVEVGGTQVAGGGPAVAWRVRLNSADFPGATHGQLIRLQQEVARTESALQKIRQYDPNWQPRTASWVRPGGIDGAIEHSKERALEAEARLDQLRTGIGGNRGPALDSVPQSASSPRAFDGAAWIHAYRSANNSSDLFGRPTWSADRDTVAVARLDGDVYFGVNSGVGAPQYTTLDRRDADAWRWELYGKRGEGNDIGGFPYNSAYHAESTALYRAYRGNGGSLADKYLEVHVDREMCRSCDRTLPELGLRLGNPTVTFVNTKTGERSTMRNGEWLP
jgi:hypothetical protein